MQLAFLCWFFLSLYPLLGLFIQSFKSCCTCFLCCVTSVTNLAAWNNTHLLSYSLYGAGIWAWLSRVLCIGSCEVAIKVLAGPDSLLETCMLKSTCRLAEEGLAEWISLWFWDRSFLLTSGHFKVTKGYLEAVFQLPKAALSSDRQPEFLGPVVFPDRTTSSNHQGESRASLLAG